MEVPVSIGVLCLVALVALWWVARKYNAKKQVEVVESVPVRLLPGDEAIMQPTAELRNGHPMARCAKTGEFAHPAYLRSVTQHPPRGDQRRRASDGWV